MKNLKNDFEISNYGLVKIIDGKLKGRFGYYDDDTDNSAIVYIGSIMLNSEYYIIPYNNLSNDYTINDLTDRLDKINQILFNSKSCKEKYLLLGEKILIGKYLNM